jgi:hypothetical protein
MKNDVLATPSPRRGFVQRLAAGTAAFLAAPVSLVASPAHTLRAAPDDPVFARIKGKHRQVFDLTAPAEGFGPVFALTWLETTKEALGVPDSEMTAVIIMRHFAMPLALNDEVWAKYHVGEMLNVSDPTTKTTAVRNVFRESIPLHPGLTYQQLAADPRVVMLACNRALTVLSGMAGERIGVAPDVAKREWTAGLVPGITPVAYGVYGVHRAQTAGCTYCNGG